MINYAPPVITEFEVFRYEGKIGSDESVTEDIKSDVGDKIAVTLKATATSIVNSSNTQLNKLSYTITGESDTSTATLTGRDITSDFITETGTATSDSTRRISFEFNKDVFPNVFSSSDPWTFSVAVTDTVGSVVMAYSTVASGHAAFSLNPSKYGAAIGMIASGTKEEPKFEVAAGYSSYFGGPIYDMNNNEIVGYNPDNNVTPVTVKEGSATTATVNVQSATNTDTTIFTATTPGVYLVCVSERWGATSSGTNSSSGMRGIQLMKGTTDVYARVRQAAGTTEEIHQNLFAIIPLGEGEVVTRRAYQDSGKELALKSRAYQIAKIAELS